MRKFAILLLLVLIFVKTAELKLLEDESDRITRDLINYNSFRNKQNHDKIHDYYPETVYYSPYKALSKSKNFTRNMEKLGNVMREKLKKRSADTTFRGKPKTIQVGDEKLFPLQH